MTHDELFKLSQEIAEKQMKQSLEAYPGTSETSTKLVEPIYRISASIAAELIYEYDKRKNG